MRRSAALIAAAIALALAVGFWLFLPARVEEAGVAESGPDSVATPELAAQLGSVEERAAAERRTTETSEPELVVAQPQTAPVGANTGLRAVQVVRSTDLSPLPGVEVLWWPMPARDSGAVDALALWLQRSGDDASLPTGFERVVSSAKGVALLPDAEHGIRVFARCDGWSGRAQFAPGETPPMRIMLNRDAALTVRVVDRAGQPAEGATVGVAGDLSNRGYASVRARTDKEGLARFPHAFHLMAEGVETSVRLAVVLEELTEEPVGREFDPRDPPREPIELVLPDGGECEVRVVDRDGNLVLEPLEVQLASVGEADFDVRDFQPWWGNEVVRREGVTTGVALFRGVQPGVRLVASASRPGGMATYSVRVPSVRRFGERVEVELKLEGRQRIVGRVLREDGAPLADSTLSLRYLWGEDDPAEAQSYELDYKPHTDAQGRFEIEFNMGDWNDDDESSATFELAQVDARGEVTAIARVELPVRLPQGEFDVGTLRLVAVPEFASGVTLDAERRPVGGVRVSVYVPSEDESGEYDDARADTEFALSDAQGRFRLRLPARFRSVRLEARKDDLCSSRVAVERGASGVELLLEPAGQVAGQIQWAGMSSGVRLFVTSTAEGPGDNQQRMPWVSVLADGQFFVRGLRQGRYTIDVRTMEGDEPLASVAGVEVRSGETTRDPRLDPLSLASSLRVATLTILDGAGKPLSQDLNVIARYKDGNGDDYQWVPIVAGRAAVLVRDPAPAVSVMGEEFLTEYIELLTDDRTIVMRRAPTVRFQLAARVSLPPDVTLGVSLQHEQGDKAGFSWDFEQPEFDENGRASMRARHLGNYKVIVRATLRGENWKTMPLDMPALDLHVRELPAEQSFEVRCPEEPLQVALEALRRP